MAGTDQSVNLGGMMSQMGNTLATQGSSYSKGLAGNITRMTQPELNMEDPTSIDNYMRWGLKTGQLTPGQASQYGWLSTQAREKQQDKLRQDGMMAYKASQTQLNTLQTQRAAAEAAGNTTAVVKIDELIAGTENAVNLQRERLEQDPKTSEALHSIKVRERQEATYVRGQQRLAEQEAATARSQELTGRSNNITTAMLSGALDMSVLEAEPKGLTDAQKAIRAQKKSQLQAIQEGDIEAYEHAFTRYTKMSKDKKTVADKAKDKVVVTDAQFTEMGLTDAQIKNYKAMLDQFGPTRAGEWAMKQLTANQAAETKADASYKWTDDVSKTWVRTTESLMADVVSASMTESGDPTGVGATIANMSDDNRTALANRVLNRLRSSGETPTEESAKKALKAILEARTTGKGTDAKDDKDDTAEEGSWWSRFFGTGESLVDMRTAPAAETTTESETPEPEYSTTQESTITRAMALPRNKGKSREQVIAILRQGGLI